MTAYRIRAIASLKPHDMGFRFAGRVLAFDLAASQTYADLMTRARAAGTAIGAADGYIAATAAANRMTVATRDTAAFGAAGVPVINPWR